MDWGQEEGTESSRNLESLVKEAMGDSVSPSRLTASHDLGFIHRNITQSSVEGPFTQDLNTDEQPHYLLHSASQQAIFSDEIDRKTPLKKHLNKITLAPVTLLVTDQRSLLIHGGGDTRSTTSINHSDVLEVDLRDLKIKQDLYIGTANDTLEFGIYAMAPYASELADVAAYISDNSQMNGGYQQYSFDDAEFSAAKNELRKQLKTFETLSKEVDIETVLTYGIKGASIGKRRGPRAAGLRFMMGAGYALYKELSHDDGDGFDDEATTDLANTIDTEKTAEVMLRWQEAGRVHNDRRIELASGVIGAAVSIDEQTSGRHVSSVLADLDIEWISHQLETGDTTEAGIQVASEVVKPYSEELASLLEDGFFTQLDKQ